MRFRPYDGEQIRQLINTEQLFEALVQTEKELDKRYRGSMTWKRVGGREYLYRKRHADWRSLGPRSGATENAYAAFRSERAKLKEKRAMLDEQLRRAARVNRAMSLGRVPFVAARIIRRLTDRGLIGSALVIVGTPALFAYERMAAGELHASMVATDDLDLLLEARTELKVVATAPDQGLLGTLRQIDESFAPVGPCAFRAANAKGFMVDLITPVPHLASSASGRRLGTAKDDLEAAEIEGLEWLQNSPRITQTVLDEKGFPLTLVVPDPRPFALHKLWLSRQPSRDRAKARRDRAQALAVAALASDHLGLALDDTALQAFPAGIRAMAGPLREAAMGTPELLDWR